MQFRKAVLENGLEIIAEENPQAYSAALAFWVRAGSCDETPPESGVSHFLEHMAFKGTASRSADDVNREFDELGADYNARTAEEWTVYHAAVLPEYFEPTLALLADILQPALRRADFETEKQVILEEIQMYEDQPPFNADEKAKAAYFGGHPLGQSIAGTAEGITALSLDAMRHYHGRRYAPENIVLAAAGKIDFGALVETARRCCGGWERRTAPRRLPPVRPRLGRQHLVRESAAQQYTMQFSPGPPARDPQRYAAKLVTVVLGDGSGSRLFWELIDPGLVDELSIGHADSEYFGAYTTWMSCDPEQAAENAAIIREVFVAAEAEGIGETELIQAKNKVLSGLVLGAERPIDRLFAVLGNWITRREYHSIEDDCRLLEALGIKEVNAALRDWPLSQSFSMSIGPA